MQESRLFNFQEGGGFPQRSLTVAGGRQIAEQNVEAFTRRLAGKSDADYRQMVSRGGVLSRKDIAAECGFAKSALDQNPRI